MTRAYVAKKTIKFDDVTSHLAGHTYFSTPETQAYFDANSKNYSVIEVRTEQIGGRTFAAPNHELGYTESYLFGYMTTSHYSTDLFQQWMSGQTVGVSDSGETVYYYNDVVKYLTNGGVLAEVDD
jgi:hypothetical protein